MLLRELFSKVLTETSRGGSQVLANKNLVANIADQLRSDTTIPMSQRVLFKKMPDETVAQWFVDKIDAVDRRGYEGVVFARDGQYMNWLAINYSNGMDVWEDLEDVYPMAMFKWVSLKNRTNPETNQPYLDPKHQDIQKFKGVKVLANYMITHYAGVLEEIEAAAKRAAEDKKLKEAARGGSVKIVDNEDYGIWILRNWPAAILFGKSCIYCTANSQNRERFDMYSKTYPLFGLQPKKLPKLRDSRAGSQAPATIVQKFQFDANSGQFMNYLNHRADPNMIKEIFPYLHDDLVKGIKDNAEQIADAGPEEINPSTGKPIEKKVYNVEAAITSLSKFNEFFTPKKRPAPNPEEPQGSEAPPQIAPPEQPQA